ncbi:MAG: FKBP-type peptidyl-prolyl cis-trans isomerase [Desulfurivibrionaceae bacterium]
MNNAELSSSSARTKLIPCSCKHIFTTSIIGLALAGVMLIGGCAEGGRQEAPAEIKPQSAAQKASYGIGVDIGRDLANQELYLEKDMLIRGVRDGLAGGELALTAEELDRARQEFVDKRKAVLEKEAADNLAAAESFLAENAEREDVITLPSGLQYRIIRPGDGSRPSVDDNVKVHFRGSFIDGSEFDNTYEDGSPAVFPVKTVIPAWVEALPMMREGAKWELFVPAELAYGPRGAGSKIGPNQALIFELELLQIH